MNIDRMKMSSCVSDGLNRSSKGTAGAFVLASCIAMLAGACGAEDAAPVVQEEPPVEDIVSVEPDVVSAPEPIQVATAQNLQQAPAPVDAALTDTSGWVVSPPWYAAGDEPYWRLDLIDGWFVFRRAGLPEIEAPIVAPFKDGPADLFATDPITVLVSPGMCRAASGETGRAAVSVTIDDVAYTGCAFAGESAGTSAEATAVSDSIQSIDTCLAELGEPALVTGIYERGDYTTALGLRAHTGQVYECATTNGGAEVAFLDPVDPANAGPWMVSAMRFLRNGQDVEVTCASALPVGSLGQFLPKECRF